MAAAKPVRTQFQPNDKVDLGDLTGTVQTCTKYVAMVKFDKGDVRLVPVGELRTHGSQNWTNSTAAKTTPPSVMGSVSSAPTETTRPAP